MNPKNTRSLHATTRSADEPDDPGPSTAGVASGTSADEFTIRVAGEAAGEVDAAWLHDHFVQAVSCVDAAVKAVNVEVVHDDRMTQLHQEHLGIAETTDVLTFPASENNAPIEADIVVCLDEAMWRADQFDHAVERELLLYALHGLLHCAGFDDHDEESFAAMHAEEDRILEAIGVGRTFWAEVAGAAGAAGHDAAPGSERSGGAVERRREHRDRGING